MGDSSPDPCWGTIYYLDWESLRCTPHSFTLEELSHYAIAEMDPYAVQIGLTICPSFSFSQDRKCDLTEIFNAVPATDSFRRETAKGRATQRIVRILAATEPGLIFLSICAAVGQYYHEDSIAEIFHDLARCAGTPTELAPSIKTWKTVTQVFSGLFSSTEFEARVDRYTQLGASLNEVDKARLEHSSSPGVVDTLLLISRLCSGKDKDMGIQSMDGKDAGWVVAVAEWLFDRKLEIRGSFGSGDEPLYSNCGHDEEGSEFVTRFENPGVPCVGPPVETTPLVVKHPCEWAT